MQQFCKWDVSWFNLQAGNKTPAHQATESDLSQLAVQLKTALQRGKSLEAEVQKVKVQAGQVAGKLRSHNSGLEGFMRQVGAFDEPQ